VTWGAPESLGKGANFSEASVPRALEVTTSGLRQRLAKFNFRPVLIVVAGNGGSAALAVLANWIVATTLTPARFGLFSLALAIMTILQELGGPALDTAIVRFAASHSKSDPMRAEAFFKAGFRLKLLVSGLLCGGLILFAGTLAGKVYHEPLLRPLFYWMAAGLVAANLSTFILARLQAAERFTAYSIQRVLANGLKVLMLGLAWAAGRIEL
jgi:O-antigen/teichoic acid export membrane protein